LAKKGIIFEIREFTVHDGPGIRKTVFLKGCPLDCFWCQNPEGKSQKIETILKKGTPVICGQEVSSDYMAEELLKDESFFKMNKGGVTFSGGEPLMQHEFLIDIMDRIHGRIHITLDTSGYSSKKVFSDIINYSDLILFDLKHADSSIHKNITGKKNGIILDNLEILIRSNKRFVIRIPLLPGINDTPDNIRKLSDLFKEHKDSIEIEFLPFNCLVGSKIKMLNKDPKVLFAKHNFSEKQKVDYKSINALKDSGVHYKIL
jgi:pyruvate formate lyase activating enzyme